MSLPITQQQAMKAAHWLKTNFSASIEQALHENPLLSLNGFTIDTICGIACQETAYFWLNFIDKKSPAEILGRCVLDASGDFPNTQRSAFPKNTAAFQKKYGDEFTNMLINEANLTRALRGFGPKNWVYKGYGLFQYDLQYVVSNESFFREKKWYSFDECIKNVMRELTTKWNIHKNMWKTIKGYNGSGENASRYANNVVQFTAYSATV
ncbi:MAG TPA: hypothetical protein PL045_11025 [Chitinophagaceae bacterium]|nr:hypothetical protein [Chitinophagaceae bacterium]